MPITYEQYKKSLGTLFSEEKYDELLALIQGGLTNEDLLNESLLWIGLMASKKNDPKYALAALMSLSLRDSGPIPIQLLTTLLSNQLRLSSVESNSDKSALADAYRPVAAEWYRTTPTEFEAFQQYFLALLVSESAENEQLAKKMLHWHLPELTKIQSILTVIRLLPEGYLPELGAVTQQGDKLIGWIAVKSSQATPQLVIATGGKQMLLTPSELLYQDAEWSILKVEVIFAQQEMDYQTVQVGVVRAGRQQVDVLVGCPLIWMPTTPPMYQRKDEKAVSNALSSDFSNKTKLTKNVSKKNASNKTQVIGDVTNKIGSAVDVIIPVYANKEMTLACVQSVLACHSANKTPQRILVINDASPEFELVDALQALADEGHITLRHHAHNMGFIGSVNHGLSVAKGDVVLLNSDTLVHGDWLDRLQKVAYSTEKVASVTPFTNNGELMSLLAPCDPAKALTPEQLAQLDRAASIANAQDMSVPLDTGCGFCFYMTRDALADVGGLDPMLRRGYGEESDWSYRAASKGWLHLGAMNTVVAHQGGLSFGEEKRFRVMQNLNIIEKRYPDSTKNFKTCLRRDPMKHGRNRLRRVWLHEQAHTRINPTQQSELRICHSLALAERFLTDIEANRFQGHTFILARINSYQVTLAGRAPHAWRIQYTLPDQINLLQQDLQKLGVFTLYADTYSLKRWWQSTVPSVSVAATPHSMVLNAAEKANTAEKEEAADLDTLLNHAPQKWQAWQAEKHSVILAVVGQEEAFASTEFIHLANQLAAQAAPVYLMPTRYPTVSNAAIFATAKVFPMPFSLSRHDERVDFYCQHFPLDGVLLLDTLPATLQEARLLDEKRNLPWLISQDCLDRCDSMDHSAVAMKGEGMASMERGFIMLHQLKEDNVFWLTNLQQLTYGWANEKTLINANTADVQRSNANSADVNSTRSGATRINNPINTADN
ncbi:glycosyltransferase family 2 protein [Marinomonas algicola]|uniref:glycosyltransferase family 2 protein n=1 Tax=Marinomonas algicola TaxID=2773454 RepID=UPI00174D20DE|nr:glycosyltransferase [Marinomonas algicola]